MAAPNLDALYRAAFPLDRTPGLPSESERVNLRDYIDQTILDAFNVAPVFSDFVLVSERPTPAELSAILQIGERMDPPRFPLISDDCLVVVADDRIEQLLTISKTPSEGRVAYQVGFHIFKIDHYSIVSLNFFRSLIGAYEVISYPDCGLIDEYQLNGFGNGTIAYQRDSRRKRPIFLTRQGCILPRKQKKYLDTIKMSLSPIGVTISNNNLYHEYGKQLDTDKLDILALSPITENVTILRKNERGSVPTGLDYFLAACPLPQPDWGAYANPVKLGPSAKKMYSIESAELLTLNQLRALGKDRDNSWNKCLVEIEDTSNAESAAVQPVAFEEITPGEEPVRKTRERLLDGEGYPTDSKDLVTWSERKLGNRIIILNRARQALRKSKHADPRRLAQALELLAGPKLDTHLGVEGAQEAVDSLLLSLRMRDTFSNAEYLRGQTGAAYMINYAGRNLLLKRHLASNSSDFNDPRIIRIYYVYDKPTGKIIVGWLPTHLPTSQS